MHYRETKPEAKRKERNLGLNSLYKGEEYMKRDYPSRLWKRTSKLCHPCHLVGQSRFPLPAVIVQRKHSKVDNQHHFHELDHPSVEIDTYTLKLSEQQP